MSNIILNSVNKYASRELTSGDIIIQFHVDRSLAEEVLPFHLVTQDVPLRLTISDGEAPVKEVDPDQGKRTKLYAKIQIHSDAIGHSQNARRTAMKNLVGKESRKDMSVEQLEIVEQAFYHETNPPIHE